MHSRFLSLAVAAAGALLVGCSADNTGPSQQTLAPRMSLTASGATNYLLVASSTTLPANLAAQISQAGGILTASSDQIGVAYASSSDPGFRTKAVAINGLSTVDPDMVVQWVDPNEHIFEAGDLSEDAPVVGGGDETFFNLQWDMKAIHEPEAIALGADGAGVRVAIIDGGLWDQHIDLHDNIDVAHSTSFVPGFAFNQDLGTFWHATHVAGIVAAEDNGIGTIGVAPKATIIGVKALHNGSGSFEAVIQAIMYASTPIAQGGGGADIINMSLGATFLKEKAGAAHLIAALNRATTFANAHGVTLIVSAGNNGLDMDHTANVVAVPAMSPGVNAIAATGPLGFAVNYPNGATNFTRQASYTNFGQSIVDFAAPGGEDAFSSQGGICSVPRIPSGSVTTACWVFDLVISPCRGGATSTTSYCFADGTSMAAPHAAGVAALIIQKHGGHVAPDQVRAYLQASADDLGKPGNDDSYGKGFVNALRAVQ
jgi:lantibiotic leader peptide-processing serine protease